MEIVVGDMNKFISYEDVDVFFVFWGILIWYIDLIYFIGLLNDECGMNVFGLVIEMKWFY